MKIKYKIILITLILSTLFFVSCSKKESSNQLKLNDVIKCFNDNHIKLTKDRGTNMIIKGQSPHYYIVNDDDGNYLTIYIFTSEKQRKEGRIEYDKRISRAQYDRPKIVTTIFEAKNVMVILDSNYKDIYNNVSAIMKKIEN